MSLFETSYQKTKELLKNKEDIDTVIARYMFEKFGTLPEIVTEMDDYQKGVVFAFLEDIVDVHVEQQKRAEQQRRISASKARGRRR